MAFHSALDTRRPALDVRPMDMINVGIVGLGWPGERHAEGVQRCGLGHLYAICDLNDKRREGFQETYKPDKAFSNYEEMLADPTLHAVGVALPEDFVGFYSWDGWADELDNASVTGCWTRLGPLPAFSPAEPGAFLVRFMADQQDCVTWYLYLRRGEPGLRRARVRPGLRLPG